MIAAKMTRESGSAFIDIGEVRREVLQWLLVAFLGVVLVALWVTAIFPRAPRVLETTVAALLLSGILVIAWWTSQHGVRRAGGVLTVGVGLLLVGALHYYPVAVAAPWLSVVVLLAATLLGRWSSVATAAGLSLALLSIPATWNPDAGWVIGSTLVLLWVTALLAWCILRPLYHTLDWAWSTYLETVETNQRLREKQANLGRVVKSLNEAYDRVELMSRELEMARVAAEQARRLKVQFAANISHELRTPLNLIVGFAEMMIDAPHTYGEPLPIAYRSDAEAIHRNAKHLSSLIDDVLDLSQIDAERMGMYKEPAAIAELATEAATAVEVLFVRKGLTLSVDVSADLPPVYADHARLRQVFVNLLANAAKFTERGGASVTAKVVGNDLVVTVADTGIGMPPDDLPRIFEEFYQIDQSMRRRHGGSGLGLALSKQLVELHGGWMWAESKLGEGSRFHFSLPLLQNVAREAWRGDGEIWTRRLADQAKEVPVIGLLADDPVVVRLFQRHLSGYQVLPLLEGPEAEPLTPPVPMRALIAVDAPLASGERQIRRLARIPGGIPIVTCSLPDRSRATERMGTLDYLVKPVSRDRFQAALARLGTRVRRILIVDDDPDLVRLLVQMVRSISARYRVMRAYGGDQALDLLRKHRPDAVILDLAMPGTDGHELLARLKKMPDLAGIPVIVITAYGYEEMTGATCRITSATREGGMGISDLMNHLKAILQVSPTIRNIDRELRGALAD